MTADDPLRTRRDVMTPVTADLSASGFEDAEEVGHGGFGAVYRCRQVVLDRTVAVKVLTAELDEDNQARFLREQRAMGRLTGHPNIVPVLQVGVTASGRPYLVMPYYPLDSLDAWIRRQGPLPVETVLWIGVRIAGALENAHQFGIVHRDVKPGNILLTDYGEPALTDFGIARIADAFQTSAGTLTGSPAFTAPEALDGDTPTPAADVYGLGATLFAALTGHAAFERGSGEQVVAQFLRITSQPVPDLRESGIPDDVSAVVESAMSRDPRQRPSAAAVGEAIGQVQLRHGYPVGEMALHVTPARGLLDHLSPMRVSAPSPRAGGRGNTGDLPLELTSFVDRRTETSEVKNLLSTSRLVTLTGIGGVGKTRLALRAAAHARRDFADGVWVIELADVRDPALLVDVVAATLGLLDQPDRPLLDVLVHFLSSREMLLVLDNCEQVVEASAELVETLLVTCPSLRILVTSREPLDIAGEVMVRVLPLPVPDPDREPALRGLPKYDAVTLFADRAAAVVPGFELSEDNKTTVARICSRLDGLPLAIELAAARMRAMSPDQILQRLTDRYALLTRSSRTAPARQQTLRWCIDWSYELCTPVEQRMWARLSVFAGGFELDAAEQVCGADLAPENLLDVLSGLVDKSIVIREVEVSDAAVRFRMFETVRDYGREKLQGTDEDRDLRRRHRDWYQRLATDAEAGWISDRQLDLLARLEREQPNLRDVLESCLADDSAEAADAGLRIAAALFLFWSFRGQYSEGRRWLDRVLAHPAAHSIPDRVKALHTSTIMAAVQGDLRRAATFVEQARALAGQDPAPTIQALAASAEGALAMYRGELDRAVSTLRPTLEVFESSRPRYLYLAALSLLGWAYAGQGDTRRAIEYHEQIRSITEACGESLFRSTTLWGMGVITWQRREPSHAQELLLESLRINRRVHSSFVAALDLEGLAWTVADGNGERAAVLMGAAENLLRSTAGVATFLQDLSHFHDESERTVRRALGDRGFDAAFRRGQAMGMDAAVAYALGEEPPTVTPPAAGLKLTKRERQVADLVAQGLTNKQIAAKLVLSQRTAQGHVEHILSKLGFTSRTQIAAWIVDETQQESS
ncbi:protein kinase [Nocardia sp. NBC_00565]|uniref:protein kinase domain-containing protein n=1 Tax=Nocardia sp. NBC_00565 TaxID=2975993 RepID=UPI002E8150CB|nr:protein kinase [Nocardia sp. NBC_00565]WUC01626.1 protein kinase [Nocardia sp. NBC_00565]